MPEIPPVLLRFAAPPTELVETVQAKIDSLIKAADVKKGEYTIFFPPALEIELANIPRSATQG